MAPIPPSFADIIEQLNACSSSQEKFQLLIEMAKELPPMPTEYKTAESKISGCASSAWIYGTKTQDGTLQWFADADAVMPKGFLAMLIEGIQGCSADEIQKIPDSFLQESGIVSSLSPSRANGALVSFQKIKAISQELLSAQK